MGYQGEEEANSSPKYDTLSITSCYLGIDGIGLLQIVHVLHTIENK